MVINPLARAKTLSPITGHSIRERPQDTAVVSVTGPNDAALDTSFP
jgi:hypothetical protein